MKKTAEYYLNLPYTFVIIPDGNCYFIKVKELEGCMSQGDTIEEAYFMIKDAMNSWLEIAIKEGDDIPMPDSMQETYYSGKMSLRMPKSLHKKIAKEAKKESVSLNSYIVTCLAEINTYKTIKRYIEVNDNIFSNLHPHELLSNDTKKWFSDYEFDKKEFMTSKKNVVFGNTTSTNNSMN